ncbi:MAG: hypothetical protein GX213_06855 [Clostridiaceae bacterium]|nr:hypothetical protein [Clostridiaceae bacterium]
MKYNELKEFLGKYPYCFKQNKEKQREFDRRVATAEGKPIVFAHHERKDIKD